MKTLATKIIKIIISALLLIQILKTSAVAAQDVTVDVTGLALSGGIGHDCSRYLEDKHDETNHWQRCTVCGRTYNIKKHTYENYWTIGDAQNCNIANHHVFRCTDSHCGYQYSNDDGRAPHQLEGDPFGQHKQYAVRVCKKCGIWVEQHQCTIGGKKPSCKVQGTCDGCHLKWDRLPEYQVNDDATERLDATNVTHSRHCFYCQTSLLKETLSVKQEQNQPAKTIYTLRLDLDPQVSVDSVDSIGVLNQYADYADVKIVDKQISGKTVQIKLSVTAVNYYEGNILDYLYMYGSHTNGNKVYYAVYLANKGETIFSCDAEDPVIKSITQRNISESDGWTTQKEITISGTENYSHVLKIDLYEKDTGSLIYHCETQRNQDGTWQAQFQPNIEVGAQGRKYYFVVKDAMNNVKRSEDFIISKVDRIAPKVNQVDKTETSWSRTKTFRAYGTDSGVNNVSIQFNDINPIGYSQPWVSASVNGSGYSQNFILTGDVYGTAVGNVIYRDQLLNGLDKQIKVSNLDNTKPTIAKIEQASETGYTVRIYQNDENSKLGQGSGVAKIYISRDNSTPSENSNGWVSWTGGNQSVSHKGTNQSQTVELKSGGGTYYIWLKDSCGNISEAGVYVAPYILSVNPNGGTYMGNRNITSYKLKQKETLTIEDAKDKIGYNFRGWKIDVLR